MASPANFKPAAVGGGAVAQRMPDFQPGSQSAASGGVKSGTENLATVHAGLAEAADGTPLAPGGLLRISAPMARMPVGLAVRVPVREFRVRDLLAMMPGVVIESQWGSGEDLPLSSGDVQLAWSEFEVVETRLAVRVTRLA